MTETVLLHKDKDMRLAKANRNSQPYQMDLYQMMVSDKYSNSFYLYKSLNDVYT